MNGWLQNPDDLSSLFFLAEGGRPDFPGSSVPFSNCAAPVPCARVLQVAASGLLTARNNGAALFGTLPQVICVRRTVHVCPSVSFVRHKWHQL